MKTDFPTSFLGTYTRPAYDLTSRHRADTRGLHAFPDTGRGGDLLHRSGQSIPVNFLEEES